MFLSLIVSALAPQAWAVTPESPEVKQVIERALANLEKQSHGKVGGKCLVALAFLKAGRPVTHPKIQEAIKACQGMDWKQESDNYSLGISLMFMCEVDPDANRTSIEKALTELLSRQQPGGGWSYPGYQTGDTSQTQYAVLGMWISQGNGIKVPDEAMERVTNWLIRTQDPIGGWGYQGKDPGNTSRTAQTPVNGSLSAAGLGSLYIMGSVLQLIEERDVPEKTYAALKEVKEPQKKKPVRAKNVDLGAFNKALSDGDRWFAEKLDFKAIHWVHYYMYALERYRSFRELADGRFEKEPQWYNQGFVYLRDSQLKDGSWEAKEEPVAATAFACLFLLRSSKKAIAKVVGNLGDGVLLGGMGLPTNVADLRERNGKVVETPLTGSIDELLAVLADDSNPELSRLAESQQAIALDPDVTKRAGQITKLRALVSAPAFESRLVAVRSLGKVRDMDNVPLLLYALTDPDIRVVREADKALRFLSRKLEGVGLPSEPSKAQLQKVQNDWKKWYLSVRPDAELLD